MRVIALCGHALVLQQFPHPGVIGRVCFAQGHRPPGFVYKAMEGAPLAAESACGLICHCVEKADAGAGVGLYAGGETANRPFYRRVYTSGTGLGLAYTSGRIAGENAAKEK